jgi:hypothetical protein
MPEQYPSSAIISMSYSVLADALGLHQLIVVVKT